MAETTPFLKWILGPDTGISSKTIWAVMMGAIEAGRPFGYDIPHDPDDFGRCYRLLEKFPEWKPRLKEVAEKFPEWGPMVREWDKMTALYEEELPTGEAPKLYSLMKKLEDEGRIAAGWTETGSCSREKKRP
jgi:hypothetical protein